MKITYIGKVTHKARGSRLCVKRNILSLIVRSLLISSKTIVMKPINGMGREGPPSHDLDTPPL